MSKSRIYTGVMFMTAVCMIFGGWFLTERLLIRREEKFLGSTGTIAVQSEEIGFLADSGLEAAQEPEEFQGQEMTEVARALVLAVWEYGGRELPHEPLPGQMDMEQAIDAGKAWGAMMAQHVFTDELQGCDFDAVKAELYTIDTPIRTSLPESMYSYWKIRMVRDGASVELTLHADSGEVWNAKLSVEVKETCVAVYDLAYLLHYAFPFIDAETDMVWIESHDLTEYMDENVVRADDSAVYAEARQYFLKVNEEPAQEVIEFTLHGKE